MSKRALVIDDSRVMRRMLARILRDLGYQVMEADNGQEALAILQAHEDIQLALVDWHMPEMNGYEFVKVVRAQPRYKAVNLVMVTTETEMFHVADALEAGANEYVMKPFTKEIILEKLNLLGLSE